MRELRACPHDILCASPARGRSDEALIAFRNAGCGETDAHLNLALVLTLEHRWADAHQHYEFAHRSDPSSAAARKGLQQVEELMARTTAPTQPID